MKLYSPDITKPTEVNYYWHEKILVEPMPQPKQGVWMPRFHQGVDKLLYECSNCHTLHVIANYCPNCGAKMGGDTE